MSEFRLHGVIPPMATPIRADGSLDELGVERLVDHILAGGVHGLFLLGTTGEGVSCSYQLRVQLIEKTCEYAAGRAPILVAVTDTSLQESINLAESAHAAGADAVVLAPPYYLPIDPPQLERHVERFAEACPLPIVLYNIPSCTHNAFDIDTIRSCSGLPNVCGVKDSSGDLEFFAELLSTFRDEPDFFVLMGPEEQLAEAVLAGADGGVCGGANLAPELFVEIFEAASGGDRERALKLQAVALEISKTIYRIGRSWPTSIIQGLKGALETEGIIQRQTLPPIEPLNEEQQKLVEQAVESFRALVK